MGERWCLEDLDSSNGSYVRGERTEGAVELELGQVFLLAEREFEVLGLETDVDAEAHADKDAPQVRRATLASKARRADSLNQRPSFWGGLKKALTLMVKRLPWMAVNPLSELQRSIQRQPEPPLADVEVAAFLGLGAGLGATFAAIGNGVLSWQKPSLDTRVDLSLWLIPMLAGFGLLFGMFAHRMLRWLVDGLSGDSSPRSRSNLFVSLSQLWVLYGLPFMLSPLLLAYVDIRWQLLPVLLVFLAVMVTAFMVHGWIRAFEILPKAALLIRMLLALLLVSMATLTVFRVAKLVAVQTSRVGDVERASRPNAPRQSDVEPEVKAQSQSPALSPIQRFEAELQAIERALDAAPELLKEPRLRADYARLRKEIWVLEEALKLESKDRPAWEREGLLARDTRLLVFQKTGALAHQVAEAIAAQGKLPGLPKRVQNH